MMNLNWLNDAGTYESRKVGRTNIDGLIISTCNTSDEDYETAVIDENGVHVVERYSNKEEAQLGHGIWCKKAKTLEEVVELGTSWSPGDGSKIKLVRTK